MTLGIEFINRSRSAFWEFLSIERLEPERFSRRHGGHVSPKRQKWRAEVILPGRKRGRRLQRVISLLDFKGWGLWTTFVQYSSEFLIFPTYLLASLPLWSRPPPIQTSGKGCSNKKKGERSVLPGSGFHISVLKNKKFQEWEVPKMASSP